MREEGRARERGREGQRDGDIEGEGKGESSGYFCPFSTLWMDGCGMNKGGLMILLKLCTVYLEKLRRHYF